MKFERLLKIVTDGNIPMGRILFNSTSMTHWYRPIKLDDRGRTLVCSSPTRKGDGEIRWGWSDAHLLKNFRIRKVEVVSSRRAGLKGGSVIIKVYLQ